MVLTRGFTLANTDDLGLKRIPYLKVPLEEQGVVAIFHELLGAGLLKGYRTKHSSAYESYDSLMNYKPDRSVLAPSIRREIKDGANYDIFTEFKFQAGKSLLEDFDLRKRPRDLRLLICWTLDREAFRKNHIEVEEVDMTETTFHGATHRLIFPNSYGFGSQNTLHVIVLRKVIETLKDAE